MRPTEPSTVSWTEPTILVPATALSTPPRFEPLDTRGRLLRQRRDGQVVVDPSLRQERRQLQCVDLPRVRLGGGQHADL